MDNINDRYRIVTVLSEYEKKWLKRLAWKSGRSMAGYLRYLLNEDIVNNRD